MSHDFIQKHVEEAVRKRAFRMCEALKATFDVNSTKSFYIAGGCLCKDAVNDIDIFPDATEQLPSLRPEYMPSAETKNASTYSVRPYPVQICKYVKPSLNDLLMSFDFAHIRVGAKILVNVFDARSPLTVSKVEFCDEFIAAEATTSTWYTGSEYPLSSLLRAAKYYNRGRLTRGQYISSMLQILNAVVGRGFSNYADFKDQLDAVDLGLLPEDFDDSKIETLRDLFYRLNREQ